MQIKATVREIKQCDTLSVVDGTPTVAFEFTRDEEGLWTDGDNFNTDKEMTIYSQVLVGWREGREIFNYTEAYAKDWSKSDEDL